MSNPYADSELATSPSTEIMPPTIKQKLERKKDQLEAQLADVNNALSLLQANPAFESLHDALTKTRVY